MRTILLSSAVLLLACKPTKVDKNRMDAAVAQANEVTRYLGAESPHCSNSNPLTVVMDCVAMRGNAVISLRCTESGCQVITINGK